MGRIPPPYYTDLLNLADILIREGRYELAVIADAAFEHSLRDKLKAAGLNTRAASGETGLREAATSGDTVIAAIVVLVGAAIVASLMPAARASRVDVLQALRSE